MVLSTDGLGRRDRFGRRRSKYGWAGEEGQVRGKAVESGSKYRWAGEEGQVRGKAGSKYGWAGEEGQVRGRLLTVVLSTDGLGRRDRLGEG